MRLVSWNCQGDFKRKCARLLDLRPDIAVVSEVLRSDLTELGDTASHEWVARPPAPGGLKDQKGLAVIGFNGWQVAKVEQTPADRADPWNFLPVIVTRGSQVLKVLGVWVLEDAPTKGFKPEVYVRPTIKAISSLHSFLSDGDVIAAGDFNQNLKWDNLIELPEEKFARVVERLNELDLSSCWHVKSGDVHGKETVPTFYRLKSEGRPGHIDYIFLSSSLMRRASKPIIGTFAEWVAAPSGVSDHVPIIVDIPVSRQRTARFLTWNIDRKGPGTPEAAELLRRIIDQNAEVVCLTEAFASSMGELGGHQLAVRGFTWAEAQGVSLDDDEREVVLWSRHPWTDELLSGGEDLQRGGFVSGKTTTSIGLVRVVGICAPYHMARVLPAPPWSEQLRFLSGLRTYLSGQHDDTPVVLLGDFNQYVPRIWGTKDASVALQDTLGALTIITYGVMTGVTYAYVDHIAISLKLEAVEFFAVDQVHDGRQLSDKHFGVVADLRVRDDAPPEGDALGTVLAMVLMAFVIGVMALWWVGSSPSPG